MRDLYFSTVADGFLISSIERSKGSRDIGRFRVIAHSLTGSQKEVCSEFSIKSIWKFLVAKIGRQIWATVDQIYLIMMFDADMR